MPLAIIRFEEHGEVVVDLEGPELLKHLPIESTASVWKQEVYFETRIKLEGELTARVEPGTVAYWPPGRAICLFYGLSQPYSPVLRLGRIVGPLFCLSWIEEGEDVEVVEYEDYGDAGDVAKKLREEGILAASRSWEDAMSVVVLMDDFRAEVFVEKYGFPVESDALFLTDNSVLTKAAIKAVAEAVGGEVRVDVNEEGHLILSAFAEDFDELVKTLRTMERAWRRAEEAIGGLRFLPVPRKPARG